MNGSNSHEEEAFQDVKLEVPGANDGAAAAVGESGQPEALPYDRGERVKGEIAMLSPMQHPSNEAASAAEKSRPEDLTIKPFVSNKPLPVPTPSREATLTQKLELALGTTRSYFLRNFFSLNFSF